MNSKLDNRLWFTFYAWGNFCAFTFFMVYFLCLVAAMLLNEAGWVTELKSHMIIFPAVLLIFQLFDYLVKPAYFEASVLNGEIRFKTFVPNRYNKLRFIRMIFYKKNLTEYSISRQSYNGYRLVISRLGLRRFLILNKTENGSLYESKPIDISLLGIKKYTNLVLSIDRLHEKITLN